MPAPAAASARWTSLFCVCVPSDGCMHHDRPPQAASFRLYIMIMRCPTAHCEPDCRRRRAAAAVAPTASAFLDCRLLLLPTIGASLPSAAATPSKGLNSVLVLKYAAFLSVAQAEFRATLELRGRPPLQLHTKRDLQASNAAHAALCINSNSCGSCIHCASTASTPSASTGTCT